jgi:hypothetical protein
MDAHEQRLKDLREQRYAAIRRMTDAQKLSAGPEMFECFSAITKAAIRRENPSFTEREVIEELRRRIDAGDRSWEMPP